MRGTIIDWRPMLCGSWEIEMPVVEAEDGERYICDFKETLADELGVGVRVFITQSDSDAAPTEWVILDLC